MKVALISALAAAGALVTALTPWTSVGSVTVQQSQCVYVGPSGDPLATVCPTQSPA